MAFGANMSSMVPIRSNVVFLVLLFGLCEVFGQRDYTLEIHTVDNADCRSGNTAKPFFSNKDGSITSGNLEFDPNNENEYTNVSFNDIDIGEIDYFEIEFGSIEDNAWCFDEFSFGLKEMNQSDSGAPYPIKRKCSMVFQGFQTIDGDCTDFNTGGNKRIKLNVSSNSPICWNIYDPSVTNLTETPYNQEAGYLFEQSYLDNTVSREYGATFTTSTQESQCVSTNTISVIFHSNCSFHTSGGLSNPTDFVAECNADWAINTDEQTFVPGSTLGTTQSLSWFGDDIGDITYMTISISSDDQWCMGSFTVLLDKLENGTEGIGDKWVSCDMDSFMYPGFGLDTGCPEFGGYDQVTLRVDEFAPYCEVFYKNTKHPTSSPTDSVCDIDFDNVIVSWDDLYSGEDSSGSTNWTSSIELTQGINNGSGVFEVQVTVESKYLVGATFSPFSSYYDGVTENDYLGVTYVLDTNEFLNQGRLLQEANSCENRVSSSFDNKNFLSDFWDYTLSPSLGQQLGSDLYLEYGNPNIWDMSMSHSDADYCGNVKWTNTFTFYQLWNDCQDSNGDDSFELIESDDTISLNLNFYLTLVSPNPLYLELCDSGATDCGYYLVKTLISHPLSIVFSKQQTVISNKDDVSIDLFQSNPNGAVFVEASIESNTSAKFVFTLMTSVPYYMALNVDTAVVLSPTVSELESQNGNLDFIKSMTISEKSESYVLGSDCAILTDYRCWQQWEISIEITECPADNGGLLLDGSYFFSADFTCIENDATICDDYLSDEPLSITLDSVNLGYTELCDSSVYEIDWNGEISFFSDENFNETQNEFAFGDPVYARVSVSNDISNYEIFGASIEQCYICTSNISDGSSDSLETCADLTGVVDTSLFYSMPGDTSLEFTYIDNNESDTIEDFSFILPVVADDIFYLDCTVELVVLNSVTNRRRRRQQRVLLQSDDSAPAAGSGNVFETFVGIGFVSESSESEDTGGNDDENNNDSEELPSFFVILVIFCSVVLVLMGVIGGLLYYAKTGQSRAQATMMKKTLHENGKVPTLSATSTAATSVESAV